MAEMQYRTDPKSGRRLSALGFGCMRLPNSAEQREQLIVSAVAAGVNYFDTAYLYPGSEAALGGILKKNDLREKIYIADKLPHSRCKSAGDFDKFFNESLSRLQTDYIDYYLIHNVGTPEAWHRLLGLGIAQWIEAKKESGAIGCIGFSFHGKSNDFAPLLDAYAWDFCQIQYNYMNENFQAGTAGLLAIHERGLAAIIMEPLLGGKLAQKLPPKAKALFDQAAPGRSPAAWAFKWLWDKPEATVVLSGMGAMEQLAENIATVCDTPAGSLTQAERAVYAKAYEIISETYKIPCTGCSYCMPCPSGVNIPGCFAAHNMSYAMGWMAGIQLHMNATSMLGTGAAKCTGCGACLKKCPQAIEIPARLKEVRGRMEPLPIRGIMSAVRRFMG
ncbi:MAG: aldo/keto reductase [Oscillospiraceae bacterium]|nr:aldo/keto reductase [Oscillospiraceae bacterium]